LELKIIPLVLLLLLQIDIWIWILERGLPLLNLQNFIFLDLSIVLYLFYAQLWSTYLSLIQLNFLVILNHNIWLNFKFLISNRYRCNSVKIIILKLFIIIDGNWILLGCHLISICRLLYLFIIVVITVKYFDVLKCQVEFLYYCNLLVIEFDLMLAHNAKKCFSCQTAQIFLIFLMLHYFKHPQNGMRANNLFLEFWVILIDIKLDYLKKFGYYFRISRMFECQKNFNEIFFIHNMINLSCIVWHFNEFDIIIRHFFYFYIKRLLS
jgi:hypothetical protein